MTYEAIIYQRTDRVGTITLNRPDALNSTTDKMYRELSSLFSDISEDPQVGCVVLTGAGRGFCGGADVKAMNPDMKLLDRRKRHRWILRDVLEPLLRMEKPVIAAVNGPAAGAGFNIALACDFIVASDKAFFTQVFKRLALVPDLGGMYLLTRVIGLNRAKELCFTARRVSAQEGLEMGFVNHVFPHDTLLDEAMKIAVDIASGPPTALAMIKTLLNKSSTSTLDQMLEFESFAQTVAYTTPEHREGVSAFREKRQPDFSKTE
jgi:2-(1,2-epoxy-1,2-dihydrophenyl)acetyl-CoA isomerase